MGLFRLTCRSLWFYWRTNLAVFLAVVVTTAVVTGALAVGDSVQYTLQKAKNARLGNVRNAVVSQDRFFRSALADDLTRALRTPVAPVLQIRGLIANADQTRRVNQINVLGVDDRFYSLGPAQPSSTTEPGGLTLSDSLAQRLQILPGDEVVLRVERPSQMPLDVPLTPESDRTVAFRLTVNKVAGRETFGHFSLQANQLPALNAFVELGRLQEQLDCRAKANMLLAAGGKDVPGLESLDAAVRKCWTLADAALELRRLDHPGNGPGIVELRSSRVFVDDRLSEAALKASPGATGILAYFVNELRCGDRTVPYSMVAAMGPGPVSAPLLPEDSGDGEIVINQWLGDALQCKTEDHLELTYYVLGSMRKLVEQSRTFQVRRIVPMEGPALDPDLMPDFPGLADANNCRDWRPGIPIDLEKITDRDEQYWNRYRGTPKAFITLRMGQDLWSNRYGNLTAVRYAAAPGIEEQVRQEILTSVDPASVGLFFQPVAEQAAKASAGGTNFGQLFLGLSMFLIAAALILTLLVFVFGVESRSEQMGMFLAVGLPPRLVRRILLLEGGMIAAGGAVLGTMVGLLYTGAMIYGLATVWQSAVAGSHVDFYTKPLTLIAGASGGFVASLLAMLATLRKQVSRSPHDLLAGSAGVERVRKGGRGSGRVGLVVAALAAAAAVILMTWLGRGAGDAAVGVFFGAGALLLIAGLSLSHRFLATLAAARDRPMVSLVGLGLRNATRRRGRSLAVVALLACGVFLTIAVGANRQNVTANARQRSSGTGGFALYGESAVAILHDLNTPAGREAAGLDNSGLNDISVVQFRVHEGDDASCFNLNRAQQPRLLGVQPDELARRGAFSLSKAIPQTQGSSGWELLNLDLREGVVPAIGDYPTVRWSLGKNVGDEIEYIDEQGRPFRVEIVGMIGGSILQGSLVIAESQFIKRFASEGGYRVFLIDAPPATAEEVSQSLSRGLRDFGLAVTPAPQRLAEFNAVEDTYLSVFLMLGGLGLVLGSIGLGLVVLRNMLERRGELAMLRAVGFDKASLVRIVFSEHAGLIAAGLVCGVVAAAVAVAPAVRSASGQVPYGSLALTVLGVAISGAAWVWVATRSALRAGVLDGLRNE